MHRLLVESWVALALLVVAAGCGGDGGAKSIADAPDCEPGQLQVQGTLDGALVEQTMTGYSTFSFTNAVGDNAGSLNVGFPTNETVFIEFTDFARNNEIVAARGAVKLGDVNAGFCEQMTLYSGELLVPKDGGQFQFRIDQLRTTEPRCTAPPVSGELFGCFRPRVMPDAGL